MSFIKLMNVDTSLSSSSSLASRIITEIRVNCSSVGSHFGGVACFGLATFRFLLIVCSLSWKVFVVQQTQAHDGMPTKDYAGAVLLGLWVVKKRSRLIAHREQRRHYFTNPL